MRSSAWTGGELRTDFGQTVEIDQNRDLFLAEAILKEQQKTPRTASLSAEDRGERKRGPHERR